MASSIAFYLVIEDQSTLSNYKMDMSYRLREIVFSSELKTGHGDLTKEVYRLWNIESGEVVRVFSGHERGLACVHWSGNRMASGGNDKSIRVWNVDTGACLHVLTGHTDLVRTLSYDVLSGRIVSGSYDKTFVLLYCPLLLIDDILQCTTLGCRNWQARCRVPQGAF